MGLTVGDKTQAATGLGRLETKTEIEIGESRETLGLVAHRLEEDGVEHPHSLFTTETEMSFYQMVPDLMIYPRVTFKSSSRYPAQL